MKRIAFALILALVLAASGQTAAQAAQKDTLRILAIGNSFSMDAVEQNLADIARADAHCAIIGNMYIGGCSLERHHSNMTRDAAAYSYRKIDARGNFTKTEKVSISTALKDEQWDIVTLQQSSPLSGKVESYEPYLSDLIAYVRSLAPEKVKILFHQTWAYGEDAVHNAFPTYNRNQKEMYDSIMVASQKVCERHGIGVIPSGTAVQNVRGTSCRDNLTRDGYHLNHSLGRYTAACTWYEACFGRKVAGVLYRPNHMTAEQAAICQISAHMAVEKPYAVSKFGFLTPKPNYDPARIPEYVLPDPLRMEDGTPVKNSRQWEKKRRPELLGLFRTDVFGRAPEEVAFEEFEVLETKSDAFNGLATRKRVAIYLSENHKVWIDLMLYTPNQVQGQAPVFLGINFFGNHAATTEQDIHIPDSKEKSRYGEFAEVPVGDQQIRWPIEKILRAGYGVATFYRGDVAPDFDNTDNLGVKSIYPKDLGKVCGPDQWGTVAAWAWGLSRAMDYLVTDTDVDAGKVAVFGHSRLAKTALWAGATDTRFAMVVANCAGCTGSALSRRAVGETVGIINRSFPHWFCDNYKKYNENEAALPVDQHELLALIAPRPLCISSADHDFWADPEGERLSMEAVLPVYRLYGKDADARVQYHIRPGKHEILSEDWDYYLRQADDYLK